MKASLHYFTWIKITNSVMLFKNSSDPRIVSGELEKELISFSEIFCRGIKPEITAYAMERYREAVIIKVHLICQQMDVHQGHD